MPKFYQDNVKIRFSNTHVKFEGFSSSRKANKQKMNWVRLAEHGRIPTDAKYMNPRISFDGLNWWISVDVYKRQNAYTGGYFSGCIYLHYDHMRRYFCTGIIHYLSLIHI